MVKRGPDATTRQRRAASAAAGGFTLVLMIVAIAVINVLLAAAAPLWSHAIAREKEEELIFRGLQYAEAIRVFQRRFGRYPVRLEELIEVEPRSIRQLWKDPMTEDGTWGLLYADQAARPAQGAPAGKSSSVRLPVSPREARTATPRETPGPTEGEQLRPIVGVFSRSTDESIKTLYGHNHYNEWRFSVQLVMSPVGIGGMPNLPRLNGRWFGRPFPPWVSRGSGPRRRQNIAFPANPTRSKNPADQ